MMRLQPPSRRQVDRVAALAGEDFSGTPELRDLWVELERLPVASSSLRTLIRANERLRGARPELSLTANQLAHVRQPVQMIWGDHDPFGTVELGRRAARFIPHSEFHVVAGGHAPWLDDPGHVAALASRFLRT
jgi:pimeloyl-ACP methyl ester carboxylesterase